MGYGEVLSGTGDEKAFLYRPGDQNNELPLGPQDGRILGVKDSEGFYFKISCCSNS